MNGLNRARKKEMNNRSLLGLANCLPTAANCGGCHVEKNDYPFYYSIQQDTTSTRSGTSQHNTISLTNSDLGMTERERLHFLNDSPSRESNTNRLNLIYESILQSLPAHTDLRYFAVSILNSAGCQLRIPHTGIKLTIPEGAVLLDEDHLIFMAVLTTESHMPSLAANQTRLSPVLLIGPSDITLVKPAVLSFEHTADVESPWKYHLMFAEDNLNWKCIVTYGQENISTPVYFQFHNEQEASILVSRMSFEREDECMCRSSLNRWARTRSSASPFLTSKPRSTCKWPVSTINRRSACASSIAPPMLSSVA